LQELLNKAEAEKKKLEVKLGPLKSDAKAKTDKSESLEIVA